jgi:hypothetical protein
MDVNELFMVGEQMYIVAEKYTDENGNLIVTSTEVMGEAIKEKRWWNR